MSLVIVCGLVKVKFIILIYFSLVAALLLYNIIVMLLLYDETR